MFNLKFEVCIYNWYWYDLILQYSLGLIKYIGELMIYRWCPKEINHPLDLQVNLPFLSTTTRKFKARFGRNTLAGPQAALLQHYPGGFMRLLSQMHSSFRGVSGSLSARSSSSFYLLASPIPLRLFLSYPLPSAFAELSAFYFTQHARTSPQCSLSLSSKSSVFLLSSSTSLRACNAAVILVRFWRSRPPLCFLIFFLHHHIVARPFSGSGIHSRVSGPPCDAGSPWFFITLVTGVVTLLGTPSFRTWYMKAASDNARANVHDRFINLHKHN